MQAASIVSVRVYFFYLMYGEIAYSLMLLSFYYFSHIEDWSFLPRIHFEIYN